MTTVHKLIWKYTFLFLGPNILAVRSAIYLLHPACNSMANSYGSNVCLETIEISF
jgi:hypothetical protein